MVASTKSTGSGHLIWPQGDNVEDVPDDLSGAIEQATRICNWQENLPRDEMPPRWMWHLDWKLESWFTEVERKREEKFGSKKDKIPDDDDPAWDKNELAERFKR